VAAHTPCGAAGASHSNFAAEVLIATIMVPAIRDAVSTLVGADVTSDVAGTIR
jgi:hypothetical protein